MKTKELSQEGLKLMACFTMLLDHIGAVLMPSMALRAIGRIAFPLYCFLLVEGVAHTRNEKKYAKRLFIGALLAEIPFDFLFYGGMNWKSQSVMVTLLLGFFMITWARKKGYILFPLSICFFAAEFLGTDYGGWGIALIALFYITAEKSWAKLLQFIGMALIFWCMDSYRIPVCGYKVPIEMFGLLAMLPIALYSGRKMTYSKAVQWGFYLFYPLHMIVLFLMVRL